MGITVLVAAAVIGIGPPQNNTTVRVRPGAALVVRLPGNATTGFRWSVAHAPAGLPLTSARYVPTKPVRLGSGGTFVFRFVAHGGGRLLLVYRRPWERTTRPARRFSVTIALAR